MGRWKRRILLLALPGAGLAVGCLGGAERTYFDDLLDGSADATSDQSARSETSIADGSILSDATIDASNSTDDALAEPDAEIDSPSSVDGPVDGADAEGPPLDAGKDASDAAVVVVEAGCGPTTTTTNCGACGVSCEHSHSSPIACTAGTCSYSGCDAGWGDCVPAAPNTNGCETQLNSPLHCTACNVACDTTNSVDAGCNGTTCTYASCKPGWSMCKTTAPNAGGCTCNTPGCCVDAGTCQTTHSNGFSQSPPFYDCNPLNTWTDKSARAACAAYTGSPAQCTDDQTCRGFPDAGPYVCNGALNNNCDTCWSYAGTDIGTVTNCDCPGVPFGSYN